MKHVLVLDVPSIKEFVLGAERLVEIRGASALLDQLNRFRTPELLEQQFGRERVNCVFSGGGSGQFIIEAEESALDQAVESLKGEFYRETCGGLRIISGRAPYVDGGYQDSLKKAFAALNREKEEQPFLVRPALHSGLVRECESCSMPASVIDNYGDADWILCETCAKKVAFARQNRGLWKSFAEFLESNGLRNVSRPRDFEEIASASRKKGFMALVYADGNSMGKLIKTIDSSECFSFFSQTVDTAIRESCYEALYEAGVGTTGMADILLLGGDDMLVCMNADAAVPFAISAARKFEKKTREAFASSPGRAPKNLSGAGMTISLGIVFAKSHTPFSLLLDQAEQLLKSAKKGGAADKKSSDFQTPAYVDFHFLSRYNQTDVAVSRNRFLKLRDRAGTVTATLHKRPYSLDYMELLHDKARGLLDRRIPRSRLKRLGRAPFQGVMNGTLECLRLIGRARNDTHKQAIWDALDAFGCGTSVPWDGQECRSTMLVDLVELSELVGSSGKELAENASNSD